MTYSEKNKYSYITVLTSDDYLPGLVVLSYSLNSTDTKYGLFVLVTQNISQKTLVKIKKLGLEYKVIEDSIKNPTDIHENHRWYSTYSKLHVFNQTQFDKLVHLDIDMLILKNIDELFDSPHMSGTNSPSLLPRKSHWTHLNTGIFVLEPSGELFEDMISKIGKLENLDAEGTLERPLRGSDQDFINAYYPNWSNNNELHLDHGYNIFHYYLDEYNEKCGYGFEENDLTIKVIHYASYEKPWNITEESFNQIKNDEERNLEYKALNMWLDLYKKYD